MAEEQAAEQAAVLLEELAIDGEAQAQAQADDHVEQAVDHVAQDAQP
jgi:hypothetical protein